MVNRVQNNTEERKSHRFNTLKYLNKLFLSRCLQKDCFTRLHVATYLYYFLSSVEHKKRYSEECYWYSSH